METLAAINRWLAKQHVVTGASVKTRRCGAQMPLLLRSRARGLYVMSEDKTRHAQMTGQQAKVAGTVNGQPKTVALIRGVQFKGEIRRTEGEESDAQRKRYTRRFPVAVALKAPVWEIRLDELKFTDNTPALARSCTGYAPSRRSASRLNAGRSSGVRLVIS